MKDGDLELAGYTMGRDWPVFATKLGAGGGGNRNQDEENPVGNTRLFGRDQETAPTWAFEFSVGESAGQQPDTGVLAALEGLAKAWRTAVDATEPGTVVPLRYMIGGRVRRVYGRPRNFDWDPSVGIAAGNIVASAEFALQDTYTYDDVLRDSTLQLRPPPTGYVTLPAVWPLISKISSTRQGTFTVGGNVDDTPLEDVTFYGPVGNPELVSAGNWTIRYNGEIPYDGWVRINPRNRTVLNQAGAYVGGNLSRKTYLPDLTLKPGAQDLTYSGTDSSGMSKATIRWRPAYYAL